MNEANFSQAMELFAKRQNLPASLDSEDWESIPREIRESSFFMSKVMDGEILQKFRDVEERFVSGEIGEDHAYKELQAFLDGVGYKPPEGKAGGLEDLSSLRRIREVLFMNLDMVRGHAHWLRLQKGLDVFPGQRLIRVSDREEPRDWPKKWREAMEKLGDETMAIAQRETKAGDPDDPSSEWILAAPVNDPIWIEISRFRQPYPPFDWGSGMGVEEVSRKQSKEWGILPAKDSPMAQPQERSLNHGLEATPRVIDADLKDALAEQLGRFGEWDGEKVVFTDPDGTRPHTAKKLKEIWAKPAPAGHDRILQKEVLESWDEGVAPDTNDARVTLRRLFDRIENEDAPPPVLQRSVPMDAERVAWLVKVLETRTMSVPGDVAGWSWSESASGRAPENGWQVTFTLKGSTLAKDLRALRADKPGWVMVGGKRFRVIDFRQDPKTRQLVVEIEEGEQP